jgi:hypothetical protein
MNFNNIFRAHYEAKLACFIPGSSGFGKTSVVKKYGKANGMEVHCISASTLDPLTLIMPRIDEANQVIKQYPAGWLKKCCNATKEKPFLLFLDEINRVRNLQVANLLTELIQERKVDDSLFSEYCQIIAAGNWGEEDTGVLEMPDAVVQRFTFLVHAPDESEILQNMEEDLSKEILRQNSSWLAKPGIWDIPVKAVPRQIDAVAKLAKTNLLNNDELGVCARGRLGVEAGNVWLSQYRAYVEKRKTKLPPHLTEQNFEAVAKVEETAGLEVVQFLKREGQPAKLVADYLIRHASSETVRCMYESKFKYAYVSPDYPKRADGLNYYVTSPEGKRNEVAYPGCAWEFYALLLGKISERKKG